jgi:hypothetical protein
MERNDCGGAAASEPGAGVGRRRAHRSVRLPTPPASHSPVVRSGPRRSIGSERPASQWQMGSHVEGWGSGDKSGRIWLDYR